MDLDEVAEALYALPREEFTPARDARAKEAKAGGDRELAGAVGRLRRPTVAAWLVNRLARDEPGRLAELADLGESMRAAHDRLDGAALRELSARRRTVLSTLTEATRETGKRTGVPVSETVTRELEEMFTAGLASPEAARALSLGRLTTAKELADAANHWPNATLPPSPHASPRVGTPSTPSRRSEHTESTVSAHRVDGFGTSATAPASEGESKDRTGEVAGAGGVAGTDDGVKAEPGRHAGGVAGSDGVAESGDGGRGRHDAGTAEKPARAGEPTRAAGESVRAAGEPTRAAGEPTRAAGEPTRAAGESARPSAAVLRARRDLAELEARLADTEQRHAEAEADRDQAAEGEAQAHRAVADRRAELIAAEQAERDARQRARTARRTHEDAERALRDTRRRVGVARERLTALDNGSRD